MKNLLIFAGLAGLAAAVAIYFVSEDLKDYGDTDYVSDADIYEYDLKANASAPSPSPARGFNAMS